MVFREAKEEERQAGQQTSGRKSNKKRKLNSSSNTLLHHIHLSNNLTCVCRKAKATQADIMGSDVGYLQCVLSDRGDFCLVSFLSLENKKDPLKQIIKKRVFKANFEFCTRLK